MYIETENVKMDEKRTKGRYAAYVRLQKGLMEKREKTGGRDTK